MTAGSVKALPPGLWTENAGQRLGPYLVLVTIISATIPWRSKEYFSGGIDSVVILKALLSLAGLVLAYLVCLNRPTRPLRAAPVVFLVLYLTCTVLGGWSAGELTPSAVIAARVLLLATVLLLLAQCFDGELLLGCLIGALATFAVVASVTGLGALADNGRLRGGLPPLHPNELGSTCALVILWCLWKVLAGKDTWWHLGGLGAAAAVLLATGSRTPIVAAVLGAVVLVLHASAVRLRTVLLALVAVPVLFWLFADTSLAGDLLTRGQGVSGLTTLSNRTVAWQAALAPKDLPWLTWLGGGLALKRIEVPGQWWNEQILDSSWISALVQGGLVGLAICLLWVVYTLMTTLSSPPRLRPLHQAIVIYLASRGLLESGLFDASTAFLVFFLTGLATPLRAVAWSSPVIRQRLRPRAGVR